MHVDAAVLGIFQHVYGQNFAVRDHDDQLGIDLGEKGGKFFATQRFGLIYGNVMLQSIRLDRCGKQLVAASARLVGLGHDADHVFSALDKCP